MFNPHPRIESIAITPQHRCHVIDDALIEPQRWLDAALERAAEFSDSAHNAFPGPELRLPDATSAQLDAFFTAHLRRRLGVRRTLRCYSRLSLVVRAREALQPRQCIPHVDRLEVEPGQRLAASVLYLFDDPGLGGTSFYRPRRPWPETVQLLQDAAQLPSDDFHTRYDLPRDYPDDSAWFEKLATVPARHNRLIFYDGGLFHAGEIRAPERLHPDPRRGRLTFNGFFVCRRSLAPPLLS